MDKAGPPGIPGDPAFPFRVGPSVRFAFSYRLIVAFLPFASLVSHGGTLAPSMDPASMAECESWDALKCA